MFKRNVNSFLISLEKFLKKDFNCIGKYFKLLQ